LERKFDTDLENMARQQKREIEKLEMVQQRDLVHNTKKLKNDQVCSCIVNRGDGLETH
jgi:hypothetical protein